MAAESSSSWLPPPPPPPVPQRPAFVDSSENGSELSDALRQVVFIIFLLGCQHPQIVLGPLLGCISRVARAWRACGEAIENLLSGLDDDDDRARQRYAQMSQLEHQQRQSRPPGGAAAAARSAVPSLNSSERIVLHPRLARLQDRFDAARAAAQQPPRSEVSSGPPPML